MKRLIERRAIRTSIIAVIILLSSTSAAYAQSSADIEAGRALYIGKGCYECHGLAAQGSTMSGPPLSPQTPPFAAMRAYVRAPKGVMPVYSEKILSTEELLRIHSYLISLPEPRSVNTIALLASERKLTDASSNATADAPGDVAHGQAIYVAHCASCHGTAGAGGVGPVLRGVANRLDVSAIEAQVRSPTGTMPALFPSVISSSDVEDIVRYVVTLK